jgi:hypothetical protein
LIRADGLIRAEEADRGEGGWACEWKRGIEIDTTKKNKAPI